MDVDLSPKTEARLRELAAQTGRPPGDLVEDAMAGYLRLRTKAILASI